MKRYNWKIHAVYEMSCIKWFEKPCEFISLLDSHRIWNTKVNHIKITNCACYCSLMDLVFYVSVENLKHPRIQLKWKIGVYVVWWFYSFLMIIDVKVYSYWYTIIYMNTFWFIDPVTDIIGRFLSWLGSRIFTFGNVSRDTSLIIGQRSIHFARWREKYLLKRCQT